MNYTIPVLYEDAEVAVINKPVGLVVHPDGRTQEYTLVDWIREHYPAIADQEVGEPIIQTSGEEIKKPGIVHRIDRETSGVLIITKTHESFANIKKQFQDRTIEKHYRALASGFFKDDQGVIDRPIGRSRSDFRRWSAEYGARGEMREAVTEYRVLGQGVWGDVRVAYLDVAPHTGRTHQIRVHLKAIGHPLLGDELYAPSLAKLPAMPRVALHAFSVAFRGLDGAVRTVEAPLPEDFRTTLAELGLM